MSGTFIHHKTKGARFRLALVGVVAISLLSSACAGTSDGSSGTTGSNSSTSANDTSTGSSAADSAQTTSNAGNLTTLKLGMLAPISGPLPNIGAAEVNGARIAAELLSGSESGFDIKMVEADTKYDPTTATQQFREMAQAGDISAVIGLPSSASCKAVSGAATALKTVYIGDCIDSSLLANPSPYFVMGAASAPELAAGSAKVAHDKYPSVLKWDVYALDYVTGHGVADNFKQSIAKFGGSFDKEVFAPLDATDVRPFLTALQQATPVGSGKGLMVYAFGDLGATFLKQASTVQLSDRYSVIIWVNADDLALGGVGTSLPRVEGVSDFVIDAFLPENNPLLKKFVETYQKTYGTPPPYEAAKMFKAVQVAVAAAKKAGSVKSSDIQKVLVGLKADTIKGATEVNEHHYLEQQLASATCYGSKDTTDGRTFKCEDARVIPYGGN